MPGKQALAEKLLAVGLALLKDQPAEHLSLRRVAEQAGVSHQAPYVHFGDKRRFLAALAGTGLQQAADAAAEVAAAGDDPVGRLHALADAYVGFIGLHPHVHDLAHGPMVARVITPDFMRPRSRIGAFSTTQSRPASLTEPPKLKCCVGALPPGEPSTASLD